MAELTRVLLTTSTFPTDEDDSVTARFVLDLAQHLSAHVRVTVLAPAAPDTPARRRWGDIDVVRFRYFVPSRLQRATAGPGMLATMRGSSLARTQLPLLVAAQIAALPGCLRGHPGSLVNAHWIVPQGLIAAMWRRRLRVPTVITAHGGDVAFLARSPAGSRLARFIFDRSDHVIAASEYLARRVEDMLGRPLPHHAIPMGVSPTLFLPSGTLTSLRRMDDERVILFVGKLVPKKGVAVLLEALALLRAGTDSIRLLVIGGGPLEAELRAHVDRLGLAGAVQWLGWIRNHELPTYYRSADVVCLPSVRDERGETEGTPVVLQEALASGAVVVATDISGIPEILRHGKNGWLAPPADSRALAQALHGALHLDDGERMALCAAARETALEHTWQRVALRYMDVFRETFDRARSRAS